MKIDLKKIVKEGGFLTVKQYAKKNNLSVWYVRKLCRKDKLDCQKLMPGGPWLIKEKK